jgi:hypothetical protein
MWACSICGAEYENLYDARWNCDCRQDPDAIRARRERTIQRLRSLVVRVVLGPVIGWATGAIGFLAGAFPFFDGFNLGAGIGLLMGLLVGTLWGVSAWCTAPYITRRESSRIPADLNGVRIM